MLLYGASGHAKVVCSALESTSIKVNGIFDDNSSIQNLNDYKVIGKYDSNFMSNEILIISIGDNETRKIISDNVKHSFGICVAASAICDSKIQIGEGTVILHNAIIQRNSFIGKHCIINTSSSIDHDCIIEDFVHISPGVTLCGSVNIEQGTQVGAGATVIQNINIGKWCIIGAGSVIIENIPDYSIVVGVPGRIIKKIKVNE